MSTTRITFTRPAADRIANVVRIVEQGSRDEAPLTFKRVLEGGGGNFRMATFTGSWAINQFKTVTLRNSTATVQALNIFASISPRCGTAPVAIARDGTVWFSIAVGCT